MVALMRDFHFPNAKQAAKLLGSIASFLVSLSPQDAIDNVRAGIDFIGFGAPPWFSAEALGGTARIAAIGLCLILSIWSFWPVRKAKVGKPVSASAPLVGAVDQVGSPHKILMEFERIPSNVKMPEEGRIFFLDLAETDTIGLGQIFSEAGSNVSWPSKRKSGMVTRCEVTNYGPEPLIDVVISTTPIFRKMIWSDPSEEGKQTCTVGDVVKRTNAWITIDKLGVGEVNKMTFYITNPTNYSVEIGLPGGARVKTVSSRGETTAVLSRAGFRDSRTLLPELTAKPDLLTYEGDGNAGHVQSPWVKSAD